MFPSKLSLTKVAAARVGVSRKEACIAFASEVDAAVELLAEVKYEDCMERAGASVDLDGMSAG